MRTTALLLVFLFPSMLIAQERYRLPDGTRTQVDGVTMQCFVFEEYRTLRLMDVELQAFYEASELWSRRLELLQERNENLTAQLLLANEAREVLQEAWTRTYEKWEEENRLRHEAQNKPNLSAAVGWGLAIVFMVVSLTLGVVVLRR